MAAGTLRCADGQNTFTEIPKHFFKLNPDWTEENADEKYKYINQQGGKQDEEPDQLLPANTCFQACSHCSLHKDTHTYEGGGLNFKITFKK